MNFMCSLAVDGNRRSRLPATKLAERFSAQTAAKPRGGDDPSVSRESLFLKPLPASLSGSVLSSFGALRTRARTLYNSPLLRLQ